jgi:hypothetical protein
LKRIEWQALGQLISVFDWVASSKQRRYVFRIVVMWAVCSAGTWAAPNSLGAVPASDTVRTTTYDDQAEIEWMIDRATATERPVALDHELRTSLGLDGPEMWYNDVVGCFQGSLTQTISAEYSEDTLGDGLRRCSLYLWVRGGEDRTSGEYRWYSFRDTVLSLYLTINGVRHGSADPRVIGGGDRRMAIHYRLHRFDTAGWKRYGEVRGARLSEPPTPTTDDEARWCYWQLLGLVPVRDEYGWICEYSTIGSPPSQRYAVRELVCQRRVDLLRRVLVGPSPEGQIYAAEALTYLEMVEPGAIDERTGTIINSLRERDEIVRTCRTAGSFRIYPVRFSELLNDSTVRELPQRYQSELQHCER